MLPNRHLPLDGPVPGEGRTIAHGDGTVVDDMGGRRGIGE